MRVVTALTWLIVVVGAGLVGLGAFFIVDRAFTLGVSLAVLGMAVLLAATSLRSLVRNEQGLGVIY